MLGPSPLTIFICTVVALTLPLLLHLFIYRSSEKTTLPTFLLLGPSASGKTTLLTYVERGNPASTHTSQVPLAVEAMLPVATKAASSKFRSVNDPSAQAHQRFLLVDTPGHGKLRYHALDNITRRQNIKGIIYMVDAANISRTEVNSERAGLSEASEFLHDILMLLQKRSTKTTSSRVPHQIPVLIAVNKLDLFTAVPVPLVKTALEEEITRIRESRSKGLLDSGVGMGDDVDIGEDKDWLGDGGGGKFEFSQLREMNVPVVLAGGNVQGSEGVDVDGWWDWMGTNL